VAYPNNQGNPAGAIPVYITTGGSSPLGYQQITSLAAAASLTPPAGANAAVVSVSGAPVRYRDDGTAPTATVGMPLAIGALFNYTGNLAAIQFIQQSATAVLDVSYYN
jgi:apolipoprotein N-acyltransferase